MTAVPLSQAWTNLPTFVDRAFREGAAPVGIVVFGECRAYLISPEDYAALEVARGGAASPEPVPELPAETKKEADRTRAAASAE